MTNHVSTRKLTVASASFLARIRTYICYMCVNIHIQDYIDRNCVPGHSVQYGLACAFLSCKIDFNTSAIANFWNDVTCY